MTQAHSSLPWRMSARETVQDPNDAVFWYCDVLRGAIRIARVSGLSEAEARANAAFIVRACNNHYPLVEACKEITEGLTTNKWDGLEKELDEKIQETIKNAEKE